MTLKERAYKIDTFAAYKSCISIEMDRSSSGYEGARSITMCLCSFVELNSLVYIGAYAIKPVEFEVVKMHSVFMQIFL